MDKFLIALGAFALGVYNADSVRTSVPVLDPNNNSGANQ